MPNKDIKPPSNLNELLDEARPALEAMDASELVARKVTRERALELTGILRDHLSAIDPRLDAELHEDRVKQRRAQLAKLGDRAWAFYAADLRTTEALSDTARARRDALAERVAEHDRTLFKWASPLFGDEPAAAENLRDIARGTGRRDSGEDVLRLVKMFRDAWPEVKGLTPVSAAMLDEAEGEATELLELLRPGAGNPARELAARAYSAWHHDYNDLLGVGRYLSWGERDSTTRFPGIHNPASRPTTNEPQPSSSDTEQEPVSEATSEA